MVGRDLVSDTGLKGILQHSDLSFNRQVHPLDHAVALRFSDGRLLQKGLCWRSLPADVIEQVYDRRLLVTPQNEICVFQTELPQEGTDAPGRKIVARACTGTTLASTDFESRCLATMITLVFSSPLLPQRQRKKTKPKYHERFTRQTLSMMFG